MMRLRRRGVVRALGTGGTAYLLGFVYAFALLGMEKAGWIAARSTDVCEVISYAAISVAIPFFMFSCNWREIRKMTHRTLACFGLLTASAAAAAVVCFFIFGSKMPQGNVLGGMSAALYTGGTPNLNAVAGTFHLPQDVVVVSNLSDIVFGGIFYLFLLFLAGPLVGKILPKAQKNTETGRNVTADADRQYGRRSPLKSILRNAVLALLIVAVAAGCGVLGWLSAGKKEGTLFNWLVPALMIGTTAGGIAFSFVPRVNDLPENGIIGEYLTAVFGFSVASTVTVGTLDGKALPVFLFFAAATLLTFLLHLVLCRAARIEADLMLTAVTAGIYGPAFVPGVCRATKNESMIPVGLLLGSLGYVLGTPLGILIALLLK